jgi:hypothetical protein
MTLMGWGVLPLALVLYIVGTPARKRRLREREARQDDAATRADADPQCRPGDKAKRTPDGDNDDAGMD